MKKFNIGYHVVTILKGMARMILGTISAGLAGLAIYGFVVVSSEGGYAAVGDFILALGLLFLAFLLMYLMGCGFPFNGKKQAR